MSGIAWPLDTLVIRFPISNTYMMKTDENDLAEIIRRKKASGKYDQFNSSGEKHILNVIE